MSGREIKKIGGSEVDLDAILAEIEEGLDNVMTQKNIAEAGKLHRELRVLSADDLLRHFTI